jgi:predicted nuclease of restriction endonuclease-like (RecB) superfamily
MTNFRQSDMENNNIEIRQEFAQVHDIITLRRSRALQAVNNENLLAAWEIGAFVSAKLKSSAWGSKTVMQLSEYLRSQDHTLRGYSRRNIYNMIAFYETYSSSEFLKYAEKLKLSSFAKQMHENQQEIVQFETAQIVQPVAAQFPIFLNITTLTNHFEILNTCKTLEERIFYVLYSYKERLNKRELQRCLQNNTFASLMGNKHNLSKGLKEIYPQTAVMLKDTVFIDFLGLPKKHSEKCLQHGILDNMKDFILELGKDWTAFMSGSRSQCGGICYEP